MPRCQRLESAAQTFSAQAFKLNQRGGLYSTLGRDDIGLAQRDIENLMATVTDRKEAITGRGGDSESFVAIESLESSARRRAIQRRQDFVSTTNTPYIHDPIHTGTLTRKSIPHTVSPGRSARHGIEPPRLQECSQVGISRARAAKVGYAVLDSPAKVGYGVERIRHQANVKGEVCGLRALLDKSRLAADGKAGGRSPLTVKDLRLLRASKRLRDRADLTAKSVVHDESCGREQQQEKKDGCWTEMHTGAYCVLRTLAKTLLSSLQARIQRKFLLLGFHKWQVKPTKGT